MYKKILFGWGLILGLYGPVFSTTYYVAEDGSVSASGLSWAAATTLDHALSLAAAGGDTILIAAGKYIPSGSTFLVNKDLTIKGGYSKYVYSYGSTTDLGEFYNPGTYHTVLCGDTSGDDGEMNFYANPNDVGINRSDNKAQIMTVSGNVTIDGCKFYHGGAGTTGSGGGGILCSGSAAVAINNCEFIGCIGAYGGAVYSNAAPLAITNSYFYNNAGTSAVVRVNANSTLTGCTFKGNSNISQDSNGVYVGGGSSFNMFDCLVIDSVTGHSAVVGAIYIKNNNPHSANINHCVFLHDASDFCSSYFRAGSISTGPVVWTISNCLWAGCQGNTGNGVLGFHPLYTDRGSTTININNCTFADNKDGGRTAGIKVFFLTPSPSLKNTDLSVNIKNSILWGNSGAQVYWDTVTLTFTDTAYNPFNITYSCIDTTDPGNNAALWKGNYLPRTGLICQDPQFVPGDTNYHLQPTSPCIDAGDPADSFANEPARLNGCRINMGVWGNTAEAAITPAHAAITADINGDCRVNTADLLQLRAQWLQHYP